MKSYNFAAMIIAYVLCYGAFGQSDEVAPKPKIDTAKIEKLTGLKGLFNEQEGVFKISLPRNDVKITVDQWQMPPFMGLTSWAAFTPGLNTNLMVMGDLVLLEDEVNPVLKTLVKNGLEVTALHNHFFFDQPKVYFMHIAGEGIIDELAKSLRAAFDKVKEIRTSSPTPAKAFSYSQMPPANSITGSSLEKIFGTSGQSKDGMFKVVLGREVKMPCGCKVGKEMGVNTWAAFAGTESDSVVDGDFAILESELQPVLKSLSSANINIVAIHHHMTGEQPRMLFLHFWGRGKAVKLAQAIKSALQITPNVMTMHNHAYK
jgi:hypothetical protein